MPPDGNAPITGRCYCGTTCIKADKLPTAVAYCHCNDCRRITGAPVAAFAAFVKGTVHVSPETPVAKRVNTGVRRRFCSDCGTPLTAEFDYLAGQIYVSLGIIDQAEQLPPELHSHTDNQLAWLHLNDDAPRYSASARDKLTE